jgi:bla regulator protein blaR1
MIPLVLEASVRSLGLAITVGIVLTALRVRQPQVQKPVWVGVLAGSLAMPFLLQYPTEKALTPLQLTVPESTIAVVHAAAIHAANGYAALVYILVSFLLLVRLTFAIARMLGIRHRATPLSDVAADVRVTAELQGPVTFGSTILIPTSHISWSESKRLAILTHEHAHVRSRDCLIQWFASVYSCLFWFNPLAWWLRRHLAGLAEQTSDDEVLRRNFDRSDYATWLLESVAVRPRTRSAVSMASCGVAHRIERILTGSSPSRMMTNWQTATALFPVSILIIIAAAASISLGTSATRHGPGFSDSGPRITRFPSLAELMQLYPPEAEKAGRDGLVLIAVTVDSIGQATESRIISESPSGMGFGQAASQLAPSSHHYFQG